jgi:hypothetical protein
MDAILNWLSGMWDALIGWFEGLWDALVAFLTDLPILILDKFLTALLGLINLIPVPAFIHTGLGPLFSDIDPWILWILTQVGLFQALTIVGAGYLFRFLRKIFTLFQW